jgi:hypothetical protein
MVYDYSCFTIVVIVFGDHCIRALHDDNDFLVFFSALQRLD